jgi:hypothetical protein
MRSSSTDMSMPVDITIDPEPGLSFRMLRDLPLGEGLIEKARRKAGLFYQSLVAAIDSASSSAGANSRLAPRRR